MTFVVSPRPNRHGGSMDNRSNLPSGWSLPCRVSPSPGESWTSLLRRNAALLDITVSKLADATGLVNEDALSPAQQRAAASLLGLQASDIHELTLNKWAGVAYSNQPIPARNRPGSAWTWLPPRFECPHCAESGIAHLEWRLSWITTCLAHKVFLHPRSTPSHEEAPPEDLAITKLHSVALANCDTSHFKRWRDSIRISGGLRHGPRSRGIEPPKQRAEALRTAAPLAMASTPEERCEILATWCTAMGIRELWNALRSSLQSREMIDAADALAARQWIKRRLSAANC